ncbi:MAG: hypothetical protein ABI405_05370 [Parafilimonas sp.]
MAVEFKIKITKEIIEHCKNCGAENNKQELSRNCAVAFALKNMFPDVYVTNFYIYPFGINTEERKNIKIIMPVIAQQFIKLFDGFYLMPNLRLLLPEFEFTIDIPDEAIDRINIDEIKDFINKSKNRKPIQTSSR